MKKIIKSLIILGILLLIFLILSLFRNIEPLSDFFVRYISTNLTAVLNAVFSWVPYTIYEFTLVAIVFFVITFLVSIIILLLKKEWFDASHKFLSFIIFFCLCVNIYYGTASISYGRSELPIPQYEGTIDQELIDGAFEYYLEDYNRISSQFKYDENGFLISPYSFKETNELLKNEFKRLDNKYFNPYTGKVKKLTFSRIFSELHFTGITWAPSGEITVNCDCHAVELPHTMAHEIAHNKGVYREDDANLVALYVLLTSENDYLRLGAYHAGFSSLLEIYAKTDYSKYVQSFFRLNESIRYEYVKLNEFWASHDLLSRIGQWYNNLFLKINGNENGTGDYVDSSTSEDTGKTDEEYDQPIYVITEYSPYQKAFFDHYIKQNNVNKNI